MPSGDFLDVAWSVFLDQHRALVLAGGEPGELPEVEQQMWLWTPRGRAVINVPDTTWLGIDVEHWDEGSTVTFTSEGSRG